MTGKDSLGKQQRLLDRVRVLLVSRWNRFSVETLTDTRRVGHWSYGRAMSSLMKPDEEKTNRFIDRSR